MTSQSGDVNTKRIATTQRLGLHMLNALMTLARGAKKMTHIEISYNKLWFKMPICSSLKSTYLTDEKMSVSISKQKQAPYPWAGAAVNFSPLDHHYLLPPAPVLIARLRTVSSL